MVDIFAKSQLFKSGTVSEEDLNLDDITSFLRSDGNDTSTGNITISKTEPLLRIYDSNSTSTEHGSIEFDTANNQGIGIQLNEFDSELPLAGYGLVVGPSTTNSQFPTTGQITFNVLGEIYTGATSLGSLNKVWHAGNDGSGSDLDADKLDGIQASSFLRSDAVDTATGNITFDGVVNLNSTVNFDPNGQQIVIDSDGSRRLIDFKRDDSLRMSLDHSSNQDTFNFNFTSGSNLQINGNRILTTADEGSGNGLDADTVDGNHASAFAAASHTHSYLPLSGGTLTGDLTINNTGSAGITINADTDNATETDLPFLKFTQDGGIGQLTVGVDNNKPYIYPNRTDNATQSADVNQLWLKYKDGTFQQMFHDGYHPNADKWTTARTIGMSGDVSSDNVNIDGSGNITITNTVVANDSHTHAFNNLTSKTSGTGDYATTGDLVSGKGSGGVALTINDGKGNANVTFNHQNGVPEQDGNAFRIEANTDSTSGATLYFEGKSNVTEDTSVNLEDWFTMSSNGATCLGNTVWHAGNDGSGSGLDADLLDGSHKTSFGRGLASTGNTGSTGNQYYKVARVSIPSQYGDYTVTGSMFTDSEGNTELHHEEFNFSVKQQNGSGNNPYVYLRQYRSAGTSNVLGYVIVQNTFPILVDLYVKVVGTYTVTRFWTNGESQSGRATWYSGQSGTTTQPTGWVSGGQYVNWNSGNDGDGSGLDADTVDGVHESTFMRKSANSALDMNNYNITEVNHLTFNDPGPHEGLQWVGGNDFRIFESPDDLTTNSGGNLQFTTGSTRRMTLDTSGNLDVTGRISSGTTSPQDVIDLGNATAGRGIAWGGTDGTSHYGSIWSEYSSGSLVIGAGLKGSPDSGDFHASYTGTVGYSAIELDSWSDDGIKFYTGGDTSVTAGLPVTKYERMRITPTGDVGIGTNSPSYDFHVVGNGYVDTSFRSPVFYDSNASSWYTDPAGISNLKQLKVGDGFTDSSTEETNLINLIVGSTSTGNANGIGFWENNSGFGMHLGYDGTGTGVNNKMCIYSNNSVELFKVTNGGTVQATTDMRAPIFYDSSSTSWYLDLAEYDGWRLKSSTNVSNTANLTYSWTPGTVKKLKIAFYELKPSTDSVYLALRFGSGSTYSTGSYYYKISPSYSANDQYYGSQTYMRLNATSQGSSTNEAMNGEIIIYPGDGIGRNHTMSAEVGVTNTSGNGSHHYVQGHHLVEYPSSDKMNTVQLFFSSGNLGSGKVQFYEMND